MPFASAIPLSGLWLGKLYNYIKVALAKDSWNVCCSVPLCLWKRHAKYRVIKIIFPVFKMYYEITNTATVKNKIYVSKEPKQVHFQATELQYELVCSSVDIIAVLSFPPYILQHIILNFSISFTYYPFNQVVQSCCH